MQQRIGSTAFRHHLDVTQAYDNSIDHPERMLFYAAVFGALSWGLVGLLGWCLWALLH
jgi:hypothetical protein